VGIIAGSLHCHPDLADHGCFPVTESSDCKSGKEFTNRVKKIVMLRNYIKIAWRNLLRNKLNSSINIAGLAIGMTSFILIALYVQDELKYDRFLEKNDHIFQVALNGNMGDGQEFFIGKTPASVSTALVRNFPEVEYATRVYRPGDLLIRSASEEKAFNEPKVLAVDSNFLQVFSFALKKGNRSTCLLEPNSIVLTEQTAQKYFGNSDPIGKTLLVNADKKPLLVTGVLENIPSQSTQQFDMLASTEAFPVVKRMSWSWVWLQVCTYVKLKDNVQVATADIKNMEAKFPSMVKVEAVTAFKRIGQPLDEMLKKGGKWDLHLQPYTDIHLRSGAIGQILETVSDIKYVYIFSIIALFIIVLACVNFMNLSTAQSFKRAKEVGVRKVLGSENRQLVKQFLTEAFLFSCIGALLSLILVGILIEPFNALAGKDLQLLSLFSGNIWLLIAGLVVLTGFLAGSYPAFYLARFKPAVVIKGMKQLRSGLGDLLVRNGLVVFQFTVSTALIICTIIVYKQLNFMQTKDLGLEKENTLILKNTHLLGDRQPAFKNLLKSLPEISEVSIATGVPTKANFGDSYVPEASSEGDKLLSDLSVSSFIVDEDFVPATRIQMVQGRNFSKEYNDSSSVILNEAAAKAMGWEKPLGSYITYPGNNNQRFKVIGIAKDFNVTSLHTPVGPFALFHPSSKTYGIGTSYMLLKIRPGDLGSTLSKVKETWAGFAPATPFDSAFLDDEFDALYKTEKRVSSVFFIFTGLSVFIACLGLLGLVMYNTERRTKEIGVRKVLGASAARITMMLSANFLKLVAIAFVIAAPVALYGMNKWLEDFAYKIRMEWWIFVLAACLSLSISLLTVVYQSLKAAVANPVKSLRTE
jgi:putative ABC transport system permease protein